MKRKLIKLKARIIEFGYTQSMFADKLGISSTSLSYKLNGISGLKQAEIIKIAELLCIPEEDYAAYFFPY